MTRLLAARRVLLGGGLLLALTVRASAAAPFAVVLREDGHESVAGRVTLDDRARITVLSAKPGRADWLRRVARELNATSVMHAEVTPEDDSAGFTSTSRIIKRNEPDFVPALKDYLRTYYGADLRPEQEPPMPGRNK